MPADGYNFYNDTWPLAQTEAGGNPLWWEIPGGVLAVMHSMRLLTRVAPRLGAWHAGFSFPKTGAIANGKFKDKITFYLLLWISLCPISCLSMSWQISFILWLPLVYFQCTSSVWLLYSCCTIFLLTILKTIEISRQIKLILSNNALVMMLEMFNNSRYRDLNIVYRLSSVVLR